MARSVCLEGNLHLGQEAKSPSLSSRAVPANLPSRSPKAVAGALCFRPPSPAGRCEAKAGSIPITEY